ncbi:hypothetical protein ILYODFUR_011251 [Ilyodon furcidens]|uniref:Uncharacterized protein n=1 Tax=Ilyodon furcidens TaxID=33524 RepID=A0ABV0THQ2_9TELE
MVQLEPFRHLFKSRNKVIKTENWRRRRPVIPACTQRPGQRSPTFTLNDNRVTARRPQRLHTWNNTTQNIRSAQPSLSL